MCDFTATKMFFENRHSCLSEGPTFFPTMGSKRSKTKHSPRLQGNTHTDTQTIYTDHIYNTCSSVHYRMGSNCCLESIALGFF